MQFEAGKTHRNFQTRSGNTCVLRWARESDVEQLRDFINELAEEDTYIPFSPGDNMTLEDEEEFLKSNLEKDARRNGSFIVAEIDGQIVGTTDIRIHELGRKRSQHVAVFGISVLSAYRGEGVGNELMTLALEHAETFLENIRLLRLTVFGDNMNAIALYNKHGFEEAGRVPGVYLRKGKYSDEVTMIKEIWK